MSGARKTWRSASWLTNKRSDQRLESFPPRVELIELPPDKPVRPNWWARLFVIAVVIAVLVAALGILLSLSCTSTYVDLCDPSTVPCVADTDAHGNPACCIDGPNCGVIREEDGSFTCLEFVGWTYVSGVPICTQYGIRCEVTP